MDKEILSRDLAINGKFYFNNELPIQISNAIYNFGSFDVFEILAFIDASEQLDGSYGMIITAQQIYFKFGAQGSFKYSDITKLSLQKNYQNDFSKASIKTTQTTYSFSNKTINPEILLKWLENVTDLNIELDMSLHDQIYHYTSIILNDIKNDEFEDTLLTKTQQSQLDEFFKELSLIKNLDNINYIYELENLCTRALTFFEELELDSDEIDALMEIETQLVTQDEISDEKLDHAKKYYDDMMNNYQQGDTSAFDQLKSIMSTLGINEQELAGKTPDEIEDYLCQKFNIPKSMFEKLKNKFGK